jgi:hypothetical protein
MPDTPSEEPDVDNDADRIDSSVQGPSSSAAPSRRHPIGEVLPTVTSDERELGWGDEPSGYSDDWYRNERPPHHG